mmetsp:Transcript_117866/g.263449  ORF Transcript_117866/g.263449 Transcript_117866/m.263449 type:complete len:281 (+) Transcript_117866:1475-2317(+)
MWSIIRTVKHRFCRLFIFRGSRILRHTQPLRDRRQDHRIRLLLVLRHEGISLFVPSLNPLEIISVTPSCLCEHGLRRFQQRSADTGAGTPGRLPVRPRWRLYGRLRICLLNRGDGDRRASRAAAAMALRLGIQGNCSPACGGRRGLGLGLRLASGSGEEFPTLQVETPWPAGPGATAAVLASIEECPDGTAAVELECALLHPSFAVWARRELCPCCLVAHVPKGRVHNLSHSAALPQELLKKLPIGIHGGHCQPSEATPLASALVTRPHARSRGAQPRRA